MLAIRSKSKRVSKQIQRIWRVVLDMDFSKKNTKSLKDIPIELKQLSHGHWLKNDTYVVFNLQPTATRKKCISLNL